MDANVFSEGSLLVNTPSLWHLTLNVSEFPPFERICGPVENRSSKLWIHKYMVFRVLCISSLTSCVQAVCWSWKSEGVAVGGQQTYLLFMDLWWKPGLMHKRTTSIFKCLAWTIHVPYLHSNYSLGWNTHKHTHQGNENTSSDTCRLLPVRRILMHLRWQWIHPSLPSDGWMYNVCSHTHTHRCDPVFLMIFKSRYVCCIHHDEWQGTR